MVKIDMQYCVGRIEDVFHFLGVSYLSTRPEGSKTDTEQANDTGSAQAPQNQTPASPIIAPHPRTLRKARENVRLTVKNGVSLPKIKSYLYRWLCWWARTSGSWEQEQLLHWFIEACWDAPVRQIAKQVQQDYFTLLRKSGPCSDLAQ